MYALADQFPSILTRLPRRSLAELPTRIDTATALAAELGLDELLIKRDDLTSSVYGGNKVRKLEFLLADAQLSDCDAVVTFGAAGSNHALATSIFARRLGLECAAVLTDQPPTPAVARSLRYHALLGTVLLHAEGYKTSLSEADDFAANHAGGPEHVYRIPWGGSSWLGTVGFVNAALELCAQCPGSLPDVIYVACGTMGTAVGLGLGFALADAATRVEAIQVVPNVVTNPERFINLHRETNRRLCDIDPSIAAIVEPWERVRFRSEFLGPGYAETTPGCIDAVRLMAEAEQLVLDTTYTGKALAALIADARAGELAGQRVMFWNTYNSIPYPDAIDAVDAALLPASLRRYLAID